MNAKEEGLGLGLGLGIWVGNGEVGFGWGSMATMVDWQMPVKDLYGIQTKGGPVSGH